MTAVSAIFDAAGEAPDTPRPGRPEWLGLGAVLLGHLAAVGGVAVVLQRPEVVMPPTVMGVLIEPAPPAVEPPRPLPVQPEPLPRPVVRPKPLPRPALPTLPPAPPSERAVTAPPPAPPELPAPAPVPAPPAPAAPPAPPAPPAPVVLPRLDAAHLNNPPPDYPALAKRLGEQGTVLLDVTILADGSVGDLRLKRSSGYTRLDTSALVAVRQWRFVPARRGNEPIPYRYDLPIAFSIDG